ncbi:MAG: PAS domain S-box protein, partial [Candidatus Kapabacteria bacterium]|nr:PAS domain S-box protein [Candidatus Kapabacteria bacterium]
EFERQSGYELHAFEALSDQELIEMIHPDDRHRVFHFWNRWQQAGFPDVQRIDYRILNRNGDVLWLDTYLYAERQTDGQIESIVQVCVDITPLKRAEEALRHAIQEDFRQTVQNLHAIVFRLRRHPDGTIYYALREGKLAGKYTSSLVYEQPIQNLPESLRLPFEVIERAFSGERVSYEAQQEAQWLLYTLEPVFSKDGTVAEVVGTGVDISERKLLERSLAESEHRYRSLLEGLPVGVLEIFVGDDGRQQDLYANPAFTEITGYTLDELPTVSGSSVIHPDDREWVVHRWSEWFSNPSELWLHLEYRCIRKGGQPYWLELYAVKVRQHNGWRAIEVGVDVTARKEAETQIRYLANFPELSPIAILEFTADGKLTYANPTARDSLPISELSFQHPWLAGIMEKLPELNHPLSTPWVRELIFRDQAWLQHIFWLSEYQRLQIYAPEITAQLFLRRQLQEALEHEQELAVARSRLMSTIAHEFRTPLAGIQLSVELLRDYFEHLSPAERQQELSNIAARAQDLNTLVTDFLTQSSLDALRRSMSFEMLSLQEICHEAAERIQPLLHSKSQRLEMALAKNAVYIRGDAKVLRFILLNLLTNASKYSGMHQSIHLRLRTELGTVVVEIEDHGIGIPEEDLPKLFQPFFRGSNTQGIPGVGLGLAMVKEFVEAHRGSIQLRSRVGFGTTVLLYLPIAQSE